MHLPTTVFTSLLLCSIHGILGVTSEDTSKNKKEEIPLSELGKQALDSNRRSHYAFPDPIERGGGIGHGPSGPTFSSYGSNNGPIGRFPVRNQALNQDGPYPPKKPLPLFASSGPAGPDPQDASYQTINELQQQPVNMPQVVGIDVKCSKEAMLVRVRFNVPFNGVIYAKGNYRNPDCRFAREGSGQAIYDFTVQLDRCGTTFTDNFRNGGQAYLENTIIIQMEPGIQEVWDAARRIRCLWNGLFQKVVGSRLNVDMLDIVSITYSGDAVDTYMDIQIGQGPGAPVATGLVKIGETLTLVVYVLGSDDLNVHVRECFAFSTDKAYSIQLTDSKGCVIKKKLMGPWLTTTKTQGLGGIGANTGASVISYAFLQAFKFPDTMDVNIECNVIICKYKCRTQCPADGRRKRDVPADEEDQLVLAHPPENSTTAASPAVTLVRTIRVLSPDDIPISINSNDSSSFVTLQTGSPTIYTGSDVFSEDAICLSTPTFVIALVIIMIIMIFSCILTAILCIRIKNSPAASKSSLLTRRTLTRATRTPTPLLTSSSSNA